MSPDEYEHVVSEIVADICKHAPQLVAVRPIFGRTCKACGKSGYRHQIDVFFRTEKEIYVIECKRWKDRIGVAEVLVLAARAHDIADANKGKHVHAILASTQGASREAKKLAKHFGIQIEIVQSANEFGIQIGKLISVGLHNKAVATDSIDMQIRKK